MIEGADIRPPAPDLLDAIIRLFAGDQVATTASEREALKREMRHLKMLPSKDMMILWDALHALLDDDFKPEGECRILDLACGRCEEVFVLSSLISSRMEHLPAASVRFFGSDVREPILMRAKGNCAQTCRFFEQRVGGKYSPFRYRFRAGDASQPEVWAAFPEQFDVVFFRHQNMYHGMELWSKIFSNVVQRLRPGGRVIITSYFDREHTLALNVFKSLGLELIQTMANTRSRPLVTEGKSVDRHVAILKVGDTLL